MFCCAPPLALIDFEHSAFDNALSVQSTPRY